MSSASTLRTRFSSSSGLQFPPLLLAIALVAYGIFLSRYVNAYAGGSDSSGYLNHALILRSGHVQVAPRTIAGLPHDQVSPYLYCPLGFRPVLQGAALVPTYPTGLPLLLLAVAEFAGWSEAGNITLVLHGVLGVLVTFAAARTFGLTPRWSAVSAAIVGCSPVYLSMTLQTLSDVPALVWTTGAIVAAWRSQLWPRWAYGAGVAFAMAVLIRPTDLLALAPIAVALGFNWGNWLRFGLGGLPGAMFFFLHTHAAYGKYFTTGYGDSADLDLSVVPMTFAHYARWLPVLFTPVVLGIFTLPKLGRINPRLAWLFATWTAVFAGFYVAYYHTHETWWYLRFLLPLAPGLVIGGLLSLRAILNYRLTTPLANLAFLCAILLCITNSVYWAKRLHVLEFALGERSYPVAAEWLHENLPRDAVVATMQGSGAFTFYTDLTIVRWDQIEPAEFQRVAAAVSASGRPLYAALFPFEVEDQKAFERHLPGRWTKVATVRDVGVWKWEAPALAAP
jgi:hypothetical protein